MGQAVLKTCSECGLEKPLSDYTPRADRNGTPRAQCKRCVSGYRKSRYAAVDDVRKYYRASSRKHRLGVTLEQFNAMFAAQDGCCAICKRHQSESKKTFSVDHDHATMKTRGLFLGLAYDDPAILASAISYLNTHSLNSKPAFAGKDE